MEFSKKSHAIFKSFIKSASNIVIDITNKHRFV